VTRTVLTFYEPNTIIWTGWKTPALAAHGARVGQQIKVYFRLRDHDKFPGAAFQFYSSEDSYSVKALLVNQRVLRDDHRHLQILLAAVEFSERRQSHLHTALGFDVIEYELAADNHPEFRVQGPRPLVAKFRINVDGLTCYSETILG